MQSFLFLLLLVVLIVIADKIIKHFSKSKRMEENTEINLLVGDQSTFKHLLLDFYKKNPTIEILHEHFSTSVVLMDNPDKSKVSGIIQQNLPDKVPVIFCTAMIFFKMQPKEQAS